MRRKTHRLKWRKHGAMLNVEEEMRDMRDDIWRA